LFYIRLNLFNNSILLIFFVYPGPRGSEENQFTPLGVGVNKLIFKPFVYCDSFNKNLVEPIE